MKKYIEITSLVTVKKGVAAAIKKMVTTDHFYRKDREEQFNMLNELKNALNDIYGIKEDDDAEIHDVQVEGFYGNYDPSNKVINIGRVSVITFLFCYRHHLHNIGKVNGSIPSDVEVRAWATRAFKLACPKSFEKSVKAGNVVGFKWDDENSTALYGVDEATETIVNAYKSALSL